MEMICYCEVVEITYKITRYHNPQDQNKLFITVKTQSWIRILVAGLPTLGFENYFQEMGRGREGQLRIQSVKNGNRFIR
jgi:hypothetical protein